MKRLDVRIPDENTTLLDLLERESKQFGITEARLLIQYATKYAEMTRGGLVPLLPPGSNGGNGHAYGSRFATDTDFSGSALDGSAMDALFGDPDD